MQTTGRWRRPLGQLRHSSQQICEEVSEHQDRTLEDQFGRGLQNCNRLLLRHPDPDGLQERSKDSGLGCRNKPWLLRFLQQYNAGMNSSETHFLACTSLLHASSCRCIHKKSLHSLAAFTCNKLKSTSAKPARPSNATLRDRISAKRKPWTWKLRIADASGDVTALADRVRWHQSHHGRSSGHTIRRSGPLRAWRVDGSHHSVGGAVGLTELCTPRDPRSIGDRSRSSCWRNRINLQFSLFTSLAGSFHGSSGCA